MAYPTAAQVKTGVVFGESDELTGTYAVPSVGNVREGITYGAGGTELEGTLAVETDNAKNGLVDVNERMDSADLSFMRGSLPATGTVAIYIEGETRATAHARIVNGKFIDPVQLPAGETYTLRFKDIQGAVKQTATLTL